MIRKVSEKSKSIDLRNKGYSYSEILKEIPVAKSTLSEWLKSVGLAKSHKIRLTNKRLEASKRGGMSKLNHRIKVTAKIKEEVDKIEFILNDDKLWLIGLMLYWAEGAKTKEYRPSADLKFSNSDPRMVRMFVIWCKKFFNLDNDNLDISLYIHESHKDKIDEYKKYWSNCIGLPIQSFVKIYFKRHGLSTNRRNIGDSYKGLLQVRVKASTNLNRKVEAWVNKICVHCGIV